MWSPMRSNNFNDSRSSSSSSDERRHVQALLSASVEQFLPGPGILLLFKSHRKQSLQPEHEHVICPQQHGRSLQRPRKDQRSYSTLRGVTDEKRSGQYWDKREQNLCWNFYEAIQPQNGVLWLERLPKIYITSERNCSETIHKWWTTLRRSIFTFHVGFHDGR